MHKKKELIFGAFFWCLRTGFRPIFPFIQRSFFPLSREVGTRTEVRTFLQKVFMRCKNFLLLVFRGEWRGHSLGFMTARISLSSPSARGHQDEVGKWGLSGFHREHYLPLVSSCNLEKGRSTLFFVAIRNFFQEMFGRLGNSPYLCGGHIKIILI